MGQERVKEAPHKVGKGYAEAKGYA